MRVTRSKTTKAAAKTDQPSPGISEDQSPNVSVTKSPSKTQKSTSDKSGKKSPSKKRVAPVGKDSSAPKPKRKASSPGVTIERTEITKKPVPDEVETLKFISWNVNGLRAIVRSNLDKLKALMDSEKPDVLCLQETKLQESHVKDHKDLLPGYKSYWSCSTVKKGYSGSAVFIRNELAKDASVTYGINDSSHDGEGRSITVEFPTVFLVALYVPNSGVKLERLDYRTTSWDTQLRKYVKELEAKGKPVVVTGDLNVAHLDIDIHNPDAKHIPKTSGCTKQERDSFSVFLEQGFVDSFRAMNPEAKGAFTYWSVRAGNRQWNKGLRLDYFVCSEEMTKEDAKVSLHDSYILENITLGASDHCPVGAIVASK